MAQRTDRRIEAFTRTELPTLRQRWEPLDVIAFGSRVRGDALSTSDLDLILVSPKFASVPFLKRAGHVLEGLGFPPGLELLCYTPQEFEEKRQEFGIVRVATEEGILL
jgi:predicted nucleotidyltransferase